MRIHKLMNLTKEQEVYLKDVKNKNEKIHNELFKMLIDVTEALDKIKIKYILMAGTLLGAHLYEDFIPWDDDIDLAIEYKNYDIFINELKEVLPKKYKILSMDNNPKYLYPFPKIINTEIKLKSKEFGEREENAFLWIDITLLTSSTKEKQPRGINFYGKLLWLKNSDIHWTINLMKSFFKLVPTKFISKKIHKILKKQKPGKFMVEPFPYTKETKMFIDFSNLSKIKFKDKYFPCPKNIEKWLKFNYRSENTSIYSFPKKIITHNSEI